jgi:hypothetical protein
MVLVVLPDGLGAGRNVDTVAAEPHVQLSTRRRRGRPLAHETRGMGTRETAIGSLRFASNGSNPSHAPGNGNSHAIDLHGQEVRRLTDPCYSNGERRVETDNVRFLAHGTECLQVVVLPEAHGWIVNDRGPARDGLRSRGVLAAIGANVYWMSLVMKMQHLLGRAETVAAA